MPEAKDRIERVALENGWSRQVRASRRDVYEALIALSFSQTDIDGWVESTYDLLSERSGCSYKTTVDAVRDLIAAGLIEHHPPVRDPQSQRPSRYRLLPVS